MIGRVTFHWKRLHIAFVFIRWPTEKIKTTSLTRTSFVVLFPPLWRSCSLQTASANRIRCLLPLGKSTGGPCAGNRWEKHARPVRGSPERDSGIPSEAANYEGGPLTRWLQLTPHEGIVPNIKVSCGATWLHLGVAVASADHQRGRKKRDSTLKGSTAAMAQRMFNLRFETWNIPKRNVRIEDKAKPLEIDRKGERKSGRIEELKVDGRLSIKRRFWQWYRDSIPVLSSRGRFVKGLLPLQNQRLIYETSDTSQISIIFHHSDWQLDLPSPFQKSRRWRKWEYHITL